MGKDTSEDGERPTIEVQVAFNGDFSEEDEADE